MRKKGSHEADFILNIVLKKEYSFVSYSGITNGGIWGHDPTFKKFNFFHTVTLFKFIYFALLHNVRGALLRVPSILVFSVLRATTVAVIWFALCCVIERQQNNQAFL